VGRGQDLVFLWIGYCCLCIGRVGRGTVFGLVCALDIASCVVVELTEVEGVV
jgi:hypothetical protein